VCRFLFPRLLKERPTLATIQNCSIENPPFSVFFVEREERKKFLI